MYSFIADRSLYCLSCKIIYLLDDFIGNAFRISCTMYQVMFSHRYSYILAKVCCSSSVLGLQINKSAMDEPNTSTVHLSRRLRRDLLRRTCERRAKSWLAGQRDSVSHRRRTHARCERSRRRTTFT